MVGFPTWQRSWSISPEGGRDRGPSMAVKAASVPGSTAAWSETSSARVVPAAADGSSSSSVLRARRRPASCFELCAALYHWIACLFISCLALSQLLGAFWDSKTTVEHAVYGRSPLLGPSQIVGFNDVPYADRVIACVRNGVYFEPKVVSSLLAAEGVGAIEEDTTGMAVHGYRLVQRRATLTTDGLDSSSNEAYRDSCNLIASTMENIFKGCSALGYANLTRDHLRVVDDWDSDRLFVLPNTLPILIMPYWDNAVYSRHAIPTYGGDACIFRLEDAYTGFSRRKDMTASFRGVNQTVRHNRTIEWLDRPGGIWKNGWYEDLAGMRWSSDVKSSARGAPYFMMHRLFDMRSGLEVDCTEESDCGGDVMPQQWGDKFSTVYEPMNVNSVYIGNATVFGLFIYEADQTSTVRSIFDWETLLSNVSVGLLLIRWVISLISLHIGALQGKSQWFGGGIGCVANAGSFAMLPLTTLPRLKMTLAAFWTVGCRFEGQQSGLSETWFAIYPAITQLVLIYFSLLNLLAKVLRRRMSDVLFAPTVAALCLLHYFRLELAASGWLSGIDGRVPTVVFSDEVQQLQLADYFTTDVAWRMNGRVKLLFAVKLGLLGVNLVPLLLARPFPIAKRGSDPGLEGVEKALALRIKHVGGLGLSRTYIVVSVHSKQQEMGSTRSLGRAAGEVSSTSSGDGDDLNKSGEEVSAMLTPIEAFNDHVESSHEKIGGNPIPRESDEATACATISVSRGPREVVLVNSYELVRLGYIVFGDKYLITFDEWNLLSSMALFRSFCHLWNHRVVVWTLDDARSEGDTEAAGGRVLMDAKPEMWRLDDPRLQSVRWWQISSCSIQC